MCTRKYTTVFLRMSSLLTVRNSLNLLVYLRNARLAPEDKSSETFVALDFPNEIIRTALCIF